MSSGFANNKVADQPAHPHRLFSAFAIRLLESSIYKRITSEVSISSLVSVAELTSLGMITSGPETIIIW